MQIFSAPEVQNAYSLNLAPTLSVLQNMQEQQQQAARNAEQQRRVAAAARLQGIGLIGDTVTPLEKGTGFSPLDDLHAKQLGDIKAKATQMVMAGGDPASTYLYLQNATNGLRQRQADATKGITTAASLAKAAVEKDPAIDYNGTYQQYLDNIFYNKDAKGNRTFNEGFDPSVDFTRGVTPAYDQVKLNQLAQAELPKLFPLRDSADVNSGTNGISLSAKIPSYMTIDPKTKTTTYDTQPLTIKDAAGKSAVIPVLKDNVVTALYSAPNVGRQLVLEAQRQRQRQPPSVSDEDIMRLVATDYVQTHGEKPGGGVTEDASEYNRQRQARQDAQSAYFQNENLKLSRQSAARADEGLQLRKDAKKQTDAATAVSPYTVSTDYMNGTLSKNPLGAQVAAIHTVSKIFPASTGIKGSTPTLDLQTLSGQPYLKDPETGGFIKAYAFKDPADNQSAIAIDYYKKDKNEGPNPVPDTERPTRILKGQYLRKFHMGIASQIQPTKQEQKDFTQAATDPYNYNGQ